MNSVPSFNNAEPSDSGKITAALEKYDQRTLHLSLEALKSVVILDFLGQLAQYSSLCLAYRDLSSTGDATDAAKVLFSSLRWAELQPLASQVLIAPIITASVVDKEASDASVFNENKMMNKMKYDLFFGLSDRIFRATSGASVQVMIDDSY
jgi:hypothetical protein